MHGDGPSRLEAAELEEELGLVLCQDAPRVEFRLVHHVDLDGEQPQRRDGPILARTVDQDVRQLPPLAAALSTVRPEGRPEGGDFPSGAVHALVEPLDVAFEEALGGRGHPVAEGHHEAHFPVRRGLFVVAGRPPVQPIETCLVPAVGSVIGGRNRYQISEVDFPPEFRRRLDGKIGVVFESFPLTGLVRVDGKGGQTDAAISLTCHFHAGPGFCRLSEGTNHGRRRLRNRPYDNNETKRKESSAPNVCAT